jgi:hypothetical protein
LAVSQFVLNLALKTILYFRRIGRASQFLAIIRGITRIIFADSVNRLAIVLIEWERLIGVRTIRGFHEIFAFKLIGTLFRAIDDFSLIVAILLPLGTFYAKRPIGIFGGVIELQVRHLDFLMHIRGFIRLRLRQVFDRPVRGGLVLAKALNDAEWSEKKPCARENYGKDPCQQDQMRNRFPPQKSLTHPQPLSCREKYTYGKSIPYKIGISTRRNDHSA